MSVPFRFHPVATPHVLPMIHLILAIVFLVWGSHLAGAGPDAELLRQSVEEAGGSITFSSQGDPIQIDLYNGNNPMKGKGGRNTVVNDAWLEKLTGATTLTQLRLANCDVRGPGLRHIAGLTKLESLDLTLTPVTDEHFVHLAGLAELKSLSLASSGCTGTGFLHLRALTKLTDVNMHHTPASDAGLAAIAAMPNLTRLWVVHARFTDAVAASLPHFKRLTRLGIGSSLDGSSGKALALIAGVPLTDLDLFDRQATDEAVAFAAMIPTLRRLSIPHAPGVTDAAVDSILKMPALESLKIGHSKLSGAAIERLRRERPALRLDIE